MPGTVTWCVFSRVSLVSTVRTCPAPTPRRTAHPCESRRLRCSPLLFFPVTGVVNLTGKYSQLLCTGKFKCSCMYLMAFESDEFCAIKLRLARKLIIYENILHPLPFVMNCFTASYSPTYDKKIFQLYNNFQINFISPCLVILGILGVICFFFVFFSIFLSII